MTNGEKLKAVLNPRANQIRILGNWVEIEIQKLGINFSCGLDWWNTEYKEPTTKNNLGVDWESYKDVDGNSLDDLILEVLQNNFDCGNTYGYKVADEIIGLLPSVTPQEPILDKIRAEIEQLHLIGYAIVDGKREIASRAVMQIIDKYKAESEG